MNNETSPMVIIANHLECYPAVWDSSDSRYHKTDIRNGELGELAELAGLADFTEAKTKYETMRSKFRRVSFVFYNLYSLIGHRDKKLMFVFAIQKYHLK
jgi:hypothetical protein